MFAIIITDVAQTVPYAGEGILGWLNVKGQEAQATVRILGGLACVGFFLFTAMKARFAAAAVIVSLLVSGLVFWGVVHVTSISDRVDDEVNGAPAISKTTPVADTSATAASAAAAR